METGYPPATAPAGRFIGNSVPREREHCIETVLRDIEVELQETRNSAENLGDKLRPQAKAPMGKATADTPEPGDVLHRLERILEAVHSTNQHLGNAHSAISG